MNITLISPPFGNFDGDDSRPDHGDLVFPYGLGWVAAVLRARGIGVEILDVHGRRLSPREVRASLKSLRCDAVGITAMSSQYSYVRWLANEIKQVFRGKIILGGTLATYSADIVLRHTDVDICVLGEGEQTALELLGNSLLPRDIPGLAFREGEKIYRNEARRLIEDLDELPPLPYDLFDMDIYTSVSMYSDSPTMRAFASKKHRPRTMSVLAGRGCPYRCKFCSRSFTSYRCRSIPRIMDEIRYLIDTYRIERISFSDELLLASKTRAFALADAMGQMGVEWGGQGRVNVVDRELLARLKAAGCTEIGLGVETGSNELLRAMGKRATAEQSLNALKAAADLGMRVKVQLIMGYPGETERTVWETVDLLKRAGSPGRRFALIVPMPGSDLYEEAVTNGLITSEEEYLQKICQGYGHEGFFMNYMNMPRAKVLKLKRDAEKAMLRNYHQQLLRHPTRLVPYVAWKSRYEFERQIVPRWQKLRSSPFRYARRVASRTGKFTATAIGRLALRIGFVRRHPRVARGPGGSWNHEE